MVNEWTTERWIYAGQRMSAKGYLMHEFIMPDGETERYFKVSRGESYVIGGGYDVECSEKEAKLRAAQFIEKTDDERVPTWVAEDRAAKAEKVEDAAVKAAKKETDGEIGNMTLKEARVFINNGPWSTQAARLAVVLKTLGVSL